MAGEWVVTDFADAIDFQEGPGILAKDFHDHGVPLIRLSGLDRGTSLLSGCNYLDPELVEKKWTHFRLQKGDILLSTSASLGRIAVVDDEGVGAIAYTGIIRMRPRDDRLIAPFIRYLLEGPNFQEQVEAFGAGSVIRHFGPMHLRQMTVLIPPLDEQRAIAHILGTLDDKIELNRKQNETLEAMARALFKAWFVDFEPVRAKMEGRWQRGQSLLGLPAHLYDLFPDRLDDEGKPEGWEMRSVGDCFRLTMGQSPPGDTYNDTGDGLPFFQGRTDFGFRYPENRKYCSAPTRIADAEDTLVSVRAPVGDINLAWEKCCVGRGVAAVRHLSGARSFTYHAVWSIQEELRQYEHTGTVFGAINKKQFEAIGIIEPNPDLIESFEKMASPMDDEVRNNIEESRTLADLRDTLLPKLISGELRIADAEDFLKGRGS